MLLNIGSILNNDGMEYLSAEQLELLHSIGRRSLDQRFASLCELDAGAVRYSHVMKLETLLSKGGCEVAVYEQ